MKMARNIPTAALFSTLVKMLEKSGTKMFPQSSQSRYWIFSDENDLTALREKTNAEFIQKHGANMTVSCGF